MRVRGSRKRPKVGRSQLPDDDLPSAYGHGQRLRRVAGSNENHRSAAAD